MRKQIVYIISTVWIVLTLYYLNLSAQSPCDWQSITHIKDQKSHVVPAF